MRVEPLLDLTALESARSGRSCGSAGTPPAHPPIQRCERDLQERCHPIGGQDLLALTQRSGRSRGRSRRGRDRIRTTPVDRWSRSFSMSWSFERTTNLDPRSANSWASSASSARCDRPRHARSPHRVQAWSPRPRRCRPAPRAVRPLVTHACRRRPARGRPPDRRPDRGLSHAQGTDQWLLRTWRRCWAMNFSTVATVRVRRLPAAAHRRHRVRPSVPPSMAARNRSTGSSASTGSSGSPTADDVDDDECLHLRAIGAVRSELRDPATRRARVTKALRTRSSCSHRTLFRAWTGCRWVTSCWC